MKLKQTIAKVFNADGTDRTTISSEEVVLNALCAYRDKLIMTEDCESVEVQSTLLIIQEKIGEVLVQMPRI